MAGCLSWTDVGALVVSEQQASHAHPPQDFVFTPSSPSLPTTRCTTFPTATTDLTCTPQSTSTHRLTSSARLPELHQAVPASQTILHVRRPSHDSCEPHPIYPLSTPRSTSSSPPTWRTPRRTSNRPHPRLRGREVCCELTPPAVNKRAWLTRIDRRYPQEFWLVPADLARRSHQPHVRSPRACCRKFGRP